MKIIKALCLSLAIAIAGCSNSSVEKNSTKNLYKAINKADTATLHIKLTDQEFYGQYEINYRGAYKDSGDVTGVVKGDTLKGTYRFQHYGMDKWHSIPIALLKKDGKLIMGEGMTEIYMNMRYFKKGRPISYDNPKFVFKKE